MARARAAVAVVALGLVVLGVAFGPGLYRGELGGSKFIYEQHGGKMVLEFYSRWNAHVSSENSEGGGVGMATTYSQDGDWLTTGTDVFEGKRRGQLSVDRQSIDFGDGFVMIRQ